MTASDQVKKIKIFIAEDSDLQRELLTDILESSSLFNIIGYSKNGEKAIELIKMLKPDIVLMDIHMPVMDGIQAIHEIMSTCPLPIVAMSASSDADEVLNGMHALQEGALAFIEKPISLSDSRYDKLKSKLIETAKLMSEIKVVRRQHKLKKTTIDNQSSHISDSKPELKSEIEIIAIGVSTGGPIVLKTIFSLLPRDFPPILIVQHIVPGFVEGLIQWLSQFTQAKIQVADDNQLPMRGHIYFAPDYVHMGIDNHKHISLMKNNNQFTICPSANYLFQTVSKVFKEHAVGILLTGMGNDGVEQLKTIREQGGITIAQTKESSLIYGMPGLAMDTGAAMYQLNPEEIAMMLSSLSKGAI